VRSKGGGGGKKGRGVGAYAFDSESDNERRGREFLRSFATWGGNCLIRSRKDRLIIVSGRRARKTGHPSKVSKTRI